MKYVGAFLFCGAVLLGGVWWLSPSSPVTEELVGVTHDSFSETEAEFEAEPATEEFQNLPVGAPQKYTMSELQNWERAPGPLRVGLQVGHWQNQSMPEELENLERNTGAVWNGMTEAEAILPIVQIAAENLEAAGIEVDILPATIPPGYEADVFAAVHADGNQNTAINGFKFAAPRRDYAGTSQALVDLLYESYEEETGLKRDPSITRRMTAYYAFNWPRYEYAIHPFTPAVIIEVGFLTSPVDRAVFLNEPERAARGISEGIIQFLNDDSITPLPQPMEFVSVTLPISGEVVCSPIREERRARVDEEWCQPGIRDTEGNVFMLANYSTTTIAVGSTFTATGEYLPIQSVPQYFWFPYEVAGIIIEPSLPILDSWYLRFQQSD